MTDEDLKMRHEQLARAKTPEERAVIKDAWEEHSLRCIAHQAQRIKEINGKCATKEDVAEMKESIGDRIDSLHACPKFKKDPLGWLQKNWMWLVVMLAAFKYLGLIEVLKELTQLFG